MDLIKLSAWGRQEENESRRHGGREGGDGEQGMLSGPESQGVVWSSPYFYKMAAICS